MAEQESAPRYRLLTRDEIIQPGDEHLNDDAETWSAVPRWGCGMRFSPIVLMPMRRPTSR